MSKSIKDKMNRIDYSDFLFSYIYAALIDNRFNVRS